ncbi:hypothetical protein ABWH97_03805 [Nitratireductor sp. ac15]
MHPRQGFKHRAKPKSTRGRIALPGVDLQDHRLPLKRALVGCSELSLVAEFRACRQEIAPRVKKSVLWASSEPADPGVQFLTAEDLRLSSSAFRFSSPHISRR